MENKFNVEAVKQQLEKYNLADRYLEMPTSTATVELAAQALGCEEGLIAKTLSFNTKSGPIVIVVMGTARIDNKKFKQYFNEKASFIKGEEVFELIGHPVGGVCPFALKEGVKIYLDKSLEKYSYTYPAAGAPNNAVKLTIPELETITQAAWVDVCKTD